MSYSKYYNPTNWENYPSEDTAINAMHLNNLEDGVDTLDDRIVALSTDKSEVSWNQTLISGEKIAEITVNGITKDVYAPEISDSVVEQAAEQALKSEGYAVGTQGDIPVTSGLYYHNNSKYYSEQASDSASDASASAVEAGQSADDAEEEALVSEGWAVGEQNGVPGTEGSPYYENNSKYWSQQSNPTRLANLSDVNFGTLKDDEIIVYDATSQKWKNEVGVSTDLKSNTTGQFNTRTGGILNSCVVNIEPKQSGSGTPSPQNVRPITGHSSVEVGVNGRNYMPTPYLFSKTTDNGVTFTVNDDGKVSLSGNNTSGGNIGINLGYVTLNVGTYIISGLFPQTGVYATLRDGNTSAWIANLNVDEYTLTVAETKKYVIQLVVASGSGNNAVYSPMIRLASDTITTYEPYNPSSKTYTISLGQTVYGGSLDVVSGGLTVDSALVTYNGSENWYEHSSGRFYLASIPTGIDISKRTQNNLFKCNTRSYILDQTGYGAYIFYGTGGIYCSKVDADESLASFKSSLNTTNMVVVYPLATPLTIQLTPTQIYTLIGENHLDVPLTGQTLDSAVYRELFAWDDVNDVVKAVDDKKADISAIGTDESGRTTASRQYTRGERFYKDGKYCRTKTTVAQGATWTLNTNYEETSIASEQRVQEESATVPSAMSSYVTINRQTIVRCGLVVSVAMQITVNSMPSSGGVILNMPFTNQGTAKFFSIYGGSSFSPTGTGVYISSDSYEVRCASAIPDGQHWISGTYIMKTY